MFIRQQNDTYQALIQIRGQNLYRPRLTGSHTRRFHQLPVLSRPADVRQSLDKQEMWVLQGTPISVLPRTVAPTPQSETFTQYVNTLHPWELELLRHTSFAANQTSICETLSHGFRVVSNGSVKDEHGNGSFGWVMSSASGQRLVYGMGPARGRALHSYRAEACDLLSVLRFLIRYREFTHSHADWPGILATDAQSVLDTFRGKDRDPQAVDTPVDLDAGKVVLDVLCPEWDVLIEIQAATKLIPHLRIHYVKGHQDQDKAYEKLNLMGQLNVDADEQARKHGNEHGECRLFALLSPLTRAHLLLPDGTVTGKFATVLQHEATAKPLQEYIQKKTNGHRSLCRALIGTRTDWP